MVFTMLCCAPTGAGLDPIDTLLRTISRKQHSCAVLHYFALVRKCRKRCLVDLLQVAGI
jgi:hypothetical protein